MSPVELGYSLNGTPQKKITAEDGVMAILETPAGLALAKMLPNGNTRLTRQPVVNRLGHLFPEDPPYIPYSTRTDKLHYRPDSIFDFLIPRMREMGHWKRASISKTLQTEQGTVEIVATGFDKDGKPSGRR